MTGACGAKFGAVCRDLPYFAHGSLSSGACLGPLQSGHGAHPMWSALPVYFLADEKHSHNLQLRTSGSFR